MFKFSRLSPAAGMVADTPSTSSLRVAWLVSLLLAFTCAASIGYWALQLLARPASVPSDAQAAGRLDTDTLVAAAPRLFGTTAPLPDKGPAAPARYRLWGVIGGGSEAGAALIGVDGKPPQAVAVGGAVAPGVRLDSTTYGHAVLVQNGTHVNLKLQPQGGSPTLPGVGAPPGYIPPQIGGVQAASAPAPGGVSSFTPNLAPGFAPRP
ncbi:type II secretion system protein N [Thiomonas sp.]